MKNSTFLSNSLSAGGRENSEIKNKLKGLSPNSKLLREYKNSLVGLTLEQWEASIGLILGDASLNTQNKGKTYRMKFE